MPPKIMTSNATPPPIRLTVAVVRSASPPERLAVLQQAVLSRDGSIDQLVDAAHGIGADICLNDLPGGVKSLGLPGVYGAFQLVQLDIDLMLQNRPSTLLLGIVRRELLQPC